MARLYVHGNVVKELSKEHTTESGYTFTSVYRLMSDGKLLRKNGKKWNLVRLKKQLGIDSMTINQFVEHLTNKGYAVRQVNQE